MAGPGRLLPLLLVVLDVRHVRRLRLLDDLVMLYHLLVAVHLVLLLVYSRLSPDLQIVLLLHLLMRLHLIESLIAESVVLVHDLLAGVGVVPDVLLEEHLNQDVGVAQLSTLEHVFVVLLELVDEIF